MQYQKLKIASSWLVILVIAICFVYWLFWGRILSIDIKNQPLGEIVNLCYFESLYPDISRSEISQKIGQPGMIDVPYTEEDYVEI
ncbi:hypothetical protein ACFL2R_02110 [Patescibacteria group bacterium]